MGLYRGIVQGLVRVEQANQEEGVVRCVVIGSHGNWRRKYVAISGVDLEPCPTEWKSETTDENRTREEEGELQCVCIYLGHL
jgi:hypothetical protein